MQGVSVAGGAGFENRGNSRVEKRVLRAGVDSRETWAEVDRVFTELKRQQPTTNLNGTDLSGAKLLPGVYRIKGNVHLQKSLELLGSKFPNGVFVFQVEGDLKVDPSVKMDLRQGIRAKNVFWQVDGNVSVGAQSAVKGTVVSAGNITAASGAVVEGKLLSKSGNVTLSNTHVSELGSENISDLEVTHIVSQGPYGAGSIVTYNVTLKNLGPEEETNVILNFETTSGLEILNATTSTGSPFDQQRKDWVISKFPSGTVATMTVRARIIKTEFSTTIVTVTGNGTDPNIKNNSSELSICATPSTAGAITGKSSLCINTPGNVYQIEPLAGTRKYTWTLPPGWSITSGAETNVITVSTGSAEVNGTISVRAVNACGDGPESVFSVSTVSSPPPMPSSISGPLEACVGQKELTYSINPVAGAVSYAWEIPVGWTIVRGQGTASVTVNVGTVGGKVRVTAENACGKSASSETQVTIAPAVPSAPNAITGPAQVCANSQEITYQVVAVLNASSYVWTIPAGWSIVRGQGTASVVVRAGATAGQVTVKAQNSCGVSPITSLGVSIFSDVPTIGAINGETAICFSNSEVTYAVEEISNAATYTWSVPADWRILSGQGSRRINVKVGSTGEVKLVASNPCGNAAATALKVTVSTGAPVIPSAISGSVAPCNGQEELIYSVTNASDVTAYAWTVPQGWVIISGQGTSKITVKAGSTAGSISVSGVNGCGTSPVRTLQVTPATIIPTTPASIAGETVPCIGGQQTYTVPNAVAGLTYTWALPTGWSIVSGQGTATVVVKAGNTAGQIKVTASNSCGLSASTELPVSPTTGVPALSANIQGEAAVCANTDQLTYSISSTNAASSLQWQVPAGWIILSGQGTSEIKVKAGTGSGTIQVSARNGCGQSVTRSLAVSISSAIPMAPATIAGQANLCANMGELTYTVPAVTGATTYTWSVPNTWTIVRGQGTTSLVVRVGTVAGQVQVTASNACGTSSAVALNVNMSAASPAAIGPIAGDKAFCSSTATRTYTIGENSGARTFTWSVPSGWVILSGQGTRFLSVRPGTTGGYVKVVAANYCGTTADSTNITVSQPLTVSPKAIIGSKIACLSEESLTYSVEAVTGATQYTWTVPAGWQILSGQNTRVIQVKPGAGAGTVSLVVSNACGSSAAISLAVGVSSNVAFNLGAITGQPVTCATTKVTYSVPVNASVSTYTWTVPAGWTIEAGQSTNFITVIPGASGGTLSVVGVNGCGVRSNASTLQVQVQKDLPLRPNAIQATASGLTPCAGQTGLIFKIEAVNGATAYEWTVPAGWKIESGQGTTTLTVTAGSQAGQISVIAKNACGQSEARAVAVVPSTGAPVINGEIAGTANVCANAGAVTYSITSSGASQYQWTLPTGWTLVSGQNTNAISVIPSSTGGTIRVKALNSCGVAVEKSLTVTSSAAGTMKPGVINGPIAFCASAEQRVYQVTNVAGAASYEWSVPVGWQIINGQGTTSITVIAQAGTGVVSAKAVNGCGATAEANLSVTVATGLGVAPVIIDESSPCVGNQFSVPAAAGVSYKWSISSDIPGWSITSGQGTNRVTVQGPANAPVASAKISVEAHNGTCSNTSASLDILPKFLAPELHVPNVFSPNNDGKNDTWVVANLLEYPENELVILNRWGSEVYRMKKYRNNWNGGGLAEGTYYYVLRVRLCEGQEVTRKGYITIMR
ncbi:ice-binding family protein [Rufibacter hautae]|uniref:ice-binding family protein n=1 Tax=Rufibacter hautae TaxID=2595005 RepID=UPI0016811976|nr:ice-binding family protein [Rufibacter hautae]